MSVKNSNDPALSGDIEVGKIRVLQRKIDNNGDIINGIVKRLVAQHCQPLDDYIAKIQNILQDTANPPTDAELDQFILNLPVLLYFTGEAQESLGIKEDVAKAVRMELYNEIYNTASGTIADKTAMAELATQNEYLTNISYSRAYKQIKLRMEIGNELLQSVKKVISRRISEYEMSRVDPSRIGGYNE